MALASAPSPPPERSVQLRYAVTGQDLPKSAFQIVSVALIPVPLPQVVHLLLLLLHILDPPPEVLTRKGL